MALQRISNHRGKGLLALAAILTAGLAVSSCSSGTTPAPDGDGGGSENAWPDYYPDDYGDLVEESRGEPSLDVYSIMSEEDWAPLLSEFSKLYPWIDVRTVDLGTNEVFERYYAESATGAPTADAIVSIAADGWQRFIDRGDVMPYESPELAMLPEWASEIADQGISLISTDPFAIVYNEQLLPDGAEPPQSFEDVVDLVESDPAAYRGKIATYAVDSQWAMFWYVDSHLGTEFWDGMSAMKDALRFESSGGATGEKMVSGEYAIAFYVPLSTIPRGSDSFLKFSLMDDGQPISSRAFGITQSAEAPASAKLLVDFILSETGQLQVPLMERVPYRPDVQAEVEATGWWHLEGIESQIGEDALIFMLPTEGVLGDGEFDRILDGFANL